MKGENIILVKTECGRYLLHIDKSTGKNVRIDRILRDDEFPRSKKSDAAFKELKERKRHNKNKGLKKKEFFVAFINKKVRNIISEITIEEASAYFKLLTKITMRSKGQLVGLDGKPLSSEEIAKVMCVGKRRAMTLLKRFKYLRMINTIQNPKDKRSTIYIINKEFHIMGEKIKEVFTQVYQEKLKQLMENKALGNALGTFYKMIPYFHYQTYYFVWNPDVDIRTDISKNLFENLNLIETQGKLEHIKLKDFAYYINVTPKTLTEHLNILEDLSVIKRDIQGKSVLITIHPDIVYRKDYESMHDKYYGSVIRYQFSQHKRNKRNSGRKPKKSE